MVEREADKEDADHVHRVAALTELAEYYGDDYLDRVRDGWAE
ncbi:hypothetical protein [Microlunatus sp. Y2014]